MIRKYGTINEEVNRIKSLFGESRLYGNLVEQDEQSDDVCKWFKPNQEEALDILKEVLSLAKMKKIALIFEPEEREKIDVLIKMLVANIKTIEDINCEGGIVIVCSTENTTKIDGGIVLLNSKLEDWPDGENEDVKTKLERLVEILNEIKSRCADAVGDHNDDKPEGWYGKPVALLQDYGVPDVVIGKMEGNGDQDGDYNWEYKDSKFSIKIYGIDGKADWGQFHFIEEGKSGWDEYWVGKLIIVYDIGKDDQNSRVMEGTLFWNYLLDGKYDNLFLMEVNMVLKVKLNGEIKNGYITIDGETTDPFEVGGDIVGSPEDEIYKKVLELRSEDDTKGDNTTKDGGDGAKDGSEIPTLDIDTKTAIVNGYVDDKPQNGEYDTFKSKDGTLVYKVKTGDNTEIKKGDNTEIKKGDNTGNKGETELDDKPKMKEGYNTEEDIIYISEKEGKREFKLGKMEYDKDKEVFKIISKYPFYSKKTGYLVKRTEESFWNTLSKWYTKELNSDNTTLDIKNGKKFKVIIK